MADLALPDGGEPFEVLAQGHAVRGVRWEPLAPRPSEAGTVYLVHGWGGRGAQFAAMVQPLVDAGLRVVLYDAPAHGDSDHGPAGPGTTNGMEFARALDAVFCAFGPAAAVVAHSMGTISTYLALRHGWVGAERLVFVAPMVEFDGLLDRFQEALGFGPRSRRALERGVEEFVGVAVRDFDARVQAAYSDPLPTLVLTDRGDRQTPYEDVVDFARTIGAPLITTEGLGHRKILRDPVVVNAIVDFLTDEKRLNATA
jgi:pimeloyl-ACP methyl ester carboxylesterase